MKRRLAVLVKDTRIDVVEVSSSFYKENSTSSEVRFLYPDESLRFPARGEFNSPYCVFRPVGERVAYAVEIMFPGEDVTRFVNHLDFGSTKSSEEFAVRQAVKQTGLSAEDFLQHFYNLYKRGELQSSKEMTW